MTETTNITKRNKDKMHVCVPVREKVLYNNNSQTVAGDMRNPLRMYPGIVIVFIRRLWSATILITSVMRE